jgi:hypothetical protein
VDWDCQWRTSFLRKFCPGATSPTDFTWTVPETNSVFRNPSGGTALKSEMNLHYITLQKTVSFHCKVQPVRVLQGHDRCWMWESHETKTMCRKSAGLLMLNSKVNALTTDFEMLSSSMLLKARRCYTCTDSCKVLFRRFCLNVCKLGLRGGGRFCIRK